MTALCDYKRLCFLFFLARRKKHPNWSNSKRRQQKKKPRQDEMMGKGMLEETPARGYRRRLQQRL
jgi:hypothetical protein